MKYYFARKFRAMAFDLRCRVNRPTVMLIFDKRAAVFGSPQYFLLKWFSFWRNFAEKVFYRSDRFCCSIDGNELHDF